jgi:hypothetical protein
VTPLHVTARLTSAIALPRGRLALDALLAAAVALRDQLPPPGVGAELVAIEIPVERAPCGRFHLASFACPVFDSYESRYINRRYPIEQAQTLGTVDIKRVRLTAGPQKSFRIPFETGHVEGDALEWWCVGDRDGIEALLALVPYIGKKRAVGLGRVAEWRVEPCDPWGEGFPVLRNGRPLRPLPLDYHGLAEHDVEHCALTYPYWLFSARQVCAVPPRT